MQNFRFMKANFSDPKMSRDAIIKRLTLHRQALIATRKSGLQTTRTDGEPDPLKWMERKEDARLPTTERQVIERRADLLSRHHSATTGLTHLKSDDAKKLEVLHRLQRGRLIGRTKGGMNTKLHAVTDADGRPIRFFMTAGPPLGDASIACRATGQ